VIFANNTHRRPNFNSPLTIFFMYLTQNHEFTQTARTSMKVIVYHRHKLYIRVISATVCGSQQVRRKPVHFYRRWCMGSRSLKECKAWTLTFQAQRLSYVPPESTFRYSTECGMYFVWVSEERVFISPYIIN